MGNKVKFLTSTALMAAVICILGPLSVPIGSVPVSLTNLAIYLTMYVLDVKRGAAAYCLYMLLGLAGLPVFSGFTPGPGKLFGPTGGYLIGFLPMAILIGLVVDRHWKNRLLCMAAMEAATWVPYLLGTAWLAFQAHMTFPAAFSVGVIPFIGLDLAKIVVAALVGPELKKRLAGMLLING